MDSQDHDRTKNDLGDICRCFGLIASGCVIQYIAYRTVFWIVHGVVIDGTITDGDLVCMATANAPLWVVLASPWWRQHFRYAVYLSIALNIASTLLALLLALCAFV